MPAKRKDRTTFTIRKPDPAKGRASFSIFKDSIRHGKRSQYKVSDSRLDAINKDLQNRNIELFRAVLEVKKIRDELLKLEVPSKNGISNLNSHNLKILERYKEEEIDLRQLRDPDEAFNKHLRAIKRLGGLSLRSITQKDLQKIVNASTGNVQKKLIGSYRVLLRFIGRTEVKLFGRRGDEDSDQNAKYYLTRDEFLEVLKALPANESPLLKSLFIVAFGTGARNGELHGFTEDHLITNGKGAYAVRIERQRLTSQAAKKRDKVFGPPKNRKHDAAVVQSDETVPAFKEWVAASAPDRDALRDRAGEILQDTCRKIFPTKERTHGRIHMLRASHAIELIRLGASIDQVARNLGDGVEVTQRHYARFVHTDASLEALQRIVK